MNRCWEHRTRSPKFLALLVPVLGLLLAAATATSAPQKPACVPDPSMSSVDPALVLDPGGNFPFRVITRCVVGEPLPFVQIDIWFRDCVLGGPSRLCSTQGPGVSVNGGVVSMMTDANGLAEFRIRGGGCCPGTQVQVFANGVLLATFNGVASPDPTGALRLTVAELGMFAGFMVTQNPCGDYDRDLLVNLRDLAQFAVAQAQQPPGCP